LLTVWTAMGASLEAVFNQVTIADFVSGNLPRTVYELAANSGLALVNLPLRRRRSPLCRPG
jgi:hypothetical protein